MPVRLPLGDWHHLHRIPEGQSRKTPQALRHFPQHQARQPLKQLRLHRAALAGLAPHPPRPPPQPLETAGQAPLSVGLLGGPAPHQPLRQPRRQVAPPDHSHRFAQGLQLAQKPQAARDARRLPAQLDPRHAAHRLGQQPFQPQGQLVQRGFPAGLALPTSPRVPVSRVPVSHPALRLRSCHLTSPFEQPSSVHSGTAPRPRVTNPAPARFLPPRTCRSSARGVRTDRGHGNGRC